MIEVKYDEVKGLNVAKYLEKVLNEGWEIVNIQPIKDEGMLTYAFVFRRGKLDAPGQAG